MTGANERESYNKEPKKPELLPAGENVKEIIEVLAAMYRAIHNSEEAAEGDTGVESANHQKYRGYKTKARDRLMKWSE